MQRKFMRYCVTLISTAIENVKHHILLNVTRLIAQRLKQLPLDSYPHLQLFMLIKLCSSLVQIPLLLSGMLLCLKKLSTVHVTFE